MMTSSNSRFEVRVLAPNTATRPNGLAAREQLKIELGNVDFVEVDLSDVVLTPSFADEFLGVLLVELGEITFRQKLRITNVPPMSRPLLQQILARRARKPNTDVAAHDMLHSAQ